MSNYSFAVETDGDNDGPVTLELTSGITSLFNQVIEGILNTGFLNAQCFSLLTFQILGLVCQKTLPHHPLSLGKEKRIMNQS